MLPKVLTGNLTFTSLKPCDLSTCTKGEVKAYFENTYDLNESIYSGFKSESAFYKCPDRLRLPLIFYYGHTACVYMNKLILAGMLNPEDRLNREFETMFETGVDEMSWDDTENYRMGGKFQWPKLDDVIEYRRHVREIILKLIEETPLTLPITMESPWWGLMMGMEHERIHVETSSVLIRQLPLKYVQKPEDFVYGPMKHGLGPGKNEMLECDKTEIVMGKPYDFPSYGWDNEYGHVQCNVPSFQASKYLVTNKEYMKFVQAGGYEKQDYWSEEGWKWVMYRNAKHPTFWVCSQGCKSGCGSDLASYSHCQPVDEIEDDDTADTINGHCHSTHQHLHQGLNGHDEDGPDMIKDPVKLNGHGGMDEDGGLEFGFRLRCLYSELPMPWDWPVEVNYLEAKAFCSWKGPDYRLPAEAEHHVLRGTQKPVSEGTKCDIIFQDDIPANLNLQYGSSTPVHLYPASDCGFHDTFGNVWEWVEDHFNGLPGYCSDYLYDDFSSPCFDGRHTLILGGSWISTGDEASRFARYAFRRHFFQHAGFRMARTILNNDASDEEKKVDLPVRIVTSKIYVQGSGVQENPVELDTKTLGYVPVESTFSQYHYEKEEILNDILRFEYASKEPFPVTIASCVQDIVKKYDVGTESVLHMGCATGRTTFALTETFDKVFGQDFCARFIDVCNELKSGKRVEFEEFDGFKKNKFAAAVPVNCLTNKITFKQLTWLPNEVESHDLVLTTFLDRVQNPKAWTVRLREVVRQDGLLMVVSAGEWDNKALSSHINNNFELLECVIMPLGPCMKHTNKEVHVSVWRHT